MDDREILRKIYEILKRIKTVNSIYEYNDIENDLNKIEEVLVKKYINELKNGKIVIKDREKVYEELLKKYKSKDDWKYNGFDIYHRLYYRFNQVINSTNLGNKSTDNVDMSLINLRGWIVRYWAYKFLKDKMHDKIEEFFLKDDDTVNDSQALWDKIIELDNRILQRCKSIKY